MSVRGGPVGHTNRIFYSNEAGWTFPNADWSVVALMRIDPTVTPTSTGMVFSSGITNSTNVTMFHRQPGGSNPNSHTVQYENSAFNSLDVNAGTPYDGTWRVVAMYRDGASTYQAVQAIGGNRAVSSAVPIGSTGGGTHNNVYVFNRAAFDRPHVGDMRWLIKSDETLTAQMHQDLVDGVSPALVFSSRTIHLDLPNVAGISELISSTQPTVTQTNMSDVADPDFGGGSGFQAAWARNSTTTLGAAA